MALFNQLRGTGTRDSARVSSLWRVVSTSRRACEARVVARLGLGPHLGEGRRRPGGTRRRSLGTIEGRLHLVYQGSDDCEERAQPEVVYVNAIEGALHELDQAVYGMRRRVQRQNG